MFEYLFMFPVAILVATIAMVMGVGGALFFSPIFIILFPLVGVPGITPQEAISAALITELFGFSSGFYGYSKRKLIDYKTGGTLILVSIPFAILGALIKHLFPKWLLLLVFGVGLWLIGIYTLRTNPHHSDHFTSGEVGPQREIIDANGETYRYMVCNQTFGKVSSSIGGFFTGLLSVGIGESVVATLRARCGLPMKVAAGTSVFVVTVVVLVASITDIIRGLIIEGSLGGIPWSLVMFTAPGVLIGGQLGPKLASKVKESLAEKFLIAMFFIIGTTMTILAFQ